jgi:hypothetical protein
MMDACASAMRAALYAQTFMLTARVLFFIRTPYTFTVANREFVVKYVRIASAITRRASAVHAKEVQCRSHANAPSPAAPRERNQAQSQEALKSSFLALVLTLSTLVDEAR